MTHPLLNCLTLSLLLLSTGIYGVLTRRSAVGILISIELMLNAGALNFVAFNRFVAPEKVDGQIMSIFVIALAAAEVLVGMAVLLMIFRKTKDTNVSTLNKLRY